MAHDFDPGAVNDPFASLVRDYPGPEVYPADSFRVEWGPIFHRGLARRQCPAVIGQDPAQSETVVRRILIGEAGHRTQGADGEARLLLQLPACQHFPLLGLWPARRGAAQERQRDRRLPQPVAGRDPRQQPDRGGAHARPARQRRLAEVGTNRGRPGSLPRSSAADLHIHPTEPESSSSGDPTKLKQAIQAMLANWNQALAEVRPHITHPDTPGPLVPDGPDFKPSGTRRDPRVRRPRRGAVVDALPPCLGATHREDRSRQATQYDDHRPDRGQLRRAKPT